MDTTPVVLLTGFLGAGKTTVLNHLLDAQRGQRVAVVENEFGEIDVDGQLVRGASTLFGLTEGCACCEVRDDLVQLFEDLSDSGAPRYEHVWLEASGLAEPGPMVKVFESPTLARRFHLHGVVTVVDALHILDDLHRPGAAEQIAFADLIVLNKVDLVSERALVEVERGLRRIQDVPVRRVERGRVPLSTVQDLRRMELGRALHHHHDHDHDDEVVSVAVELDGEVDLVAVDRWLGAVVRATDMEVLRIKGVLAIMGDDLRWQFQAVRRTVEARPGEPWGTGERRCQLVFIGRGLNGEGLRAGLAECRR